LDKLLENVGDQQWVEMPIDDVKLLLSLTQPDPAASECVWDPEAVAGSVGQCARLKNQDTGYVYVDRDRGLKGRRRETRGILEGGEGRKVPDDRVTLFLLRTKAAGAEHASWWPQVRFPAGQYAFAFAV
jgi:hypothetical protein